MDLRTLIVVLVLAGLALWALGQLTLDDAIKKLIRVVVVVLATLYVVYFLLGVLLPSGRLPHLVN